MHNWHAMGPLTSIFGERNEPSEGRIIYLVVSTVGIYIYVGIYICKYICRNICM